MTSKEAPSEILSFIFKNLTVPSDIKHCQLVCKSWYLPAQQKLYENARLISPKSVFKFSAAIASTHKSVISTRHLVSKVGSFVRSVSLSDLCVTFDTTSHDEGSTNGLRELVDRLAIYCPHLEALWCGQVHFKSFWEKLSLELTKKNRWPRLTYLGHPQIASVNEPYLQAAIAARCTLKRLVLRDSFGPFQKVYYQDFFNSCVANVGNLFGNLESLTLHKMTQQHVAHLDITLNTLPSTLKSLELIMDLPEVYQIPETRQTGPLARVFRRRHTNPGIFLTLSECKVNYSIRNWSVFHPLHQVTRLNGKLLLHNDDSLLYIMQKFPSLQHIELELHPVHHQNQPVQLSSSRIAQFLKFASQHALYDIHCYMPHIKDVSDHLFTADLHLFPGFVLFDFQAVTQLPKIRIHNNPHNPSQPILNLNLPVAKTTEAAEYFQRMDLLRRVGQRWRRLIFSCASFFNDDESYQDLLSRCDPSLFHFITGYCLDLVFQYCSNLEYFEWSKSQLLQCNPDDPCVNRSIHTLAIASSWVNESVFHGLSHRLPELRHLYLNDCRFMLDMSEGHGSRYWWHHGSRVYLNMPCTNLDHLYLINRETGIFDTCFLKISRSYPHWQQQHVVFISAGNEQGECVSEEKYQELSCIWKDAMHVDLYCKQLGKLVIQNRCFGHREIDIERLIASV
ncbi:MAG: hypothetical protein EXX96DRAFT_565596 [Benjaminiella poitrasii]|nr:MAG: hypothetical protein EXX96DRAFT_565596 [Benjaminiella poitrasii]